MSVPELPDELLLAIFKHFDPLVLANYCVPELVDITHVCHRWREIAVGTPELWSNIYIFHLTNKNLPLEVILRRSQHLPLKCQIYANIEVQPRKLLMRASERIETLKIKAPKCVLTRLIHLPIGPLPLLRVLEIIEKEDRTGLTDSEETLDSEQFLELFAASELTELNLDGRSFTNIEPVLQPSLTRLTLCNRYFTVDYILKALTQMPLLRFFYLSGDLPSSRSDSLRRMYKGLPLLDELHLNMRGSHGQIIRKFALVPPKRLVAVSNGYADCMVAIRDVYHDLTFVTLEWMDVLDGFICWMNYDPCSYKEAPVCILLPASSPWPLSYLFRICVRYAINLRAVQHLGIGGSVAESDMQFILNGMENLVTLRIAGKLAVKAFLMRMDLKAKEAKAYRTALAAQGEEGEGRQQTVGVQGVRNPRLLPKLQTMILEDMDPEDFPLEYIHQALWLIDASHSAPLSRLIIRMPFGMDRSVLNNLQSMEVEEVVWDDGMDWLGVKEEKIDPNIVELVMSAKRFSKSP